MKGGPKAQFDAKYSEAEHLKYGEIIDTFRNEGASAAQNLILKLKTEEKVTLARYKSDYQEMLRAQSKLAHQLQSLLKEREVIREDLQEMKSTRNLMIYNLQNKLSSAISEGRHTNNTSTTPTNKKKNSV